MADFALMMSQMSGMRADIKAGKKSSGGGAGASGNVSGARAAEVVFDMLDDDGNGTLSKIEIMDFCNQHAVNVAKTMQALSVGGKYTVTKATFVEKYENGELPDEVEKLINEQASAKKGTMAPWIKIQADTFLNWINIKLDSAKANRVGSLEQGLKDGTALIRVLEVVTKKPIHNKKWKRNPKMKIHSIENINIAFQFVDRESPNQKLIVNIGPEDIYDGDLKLLLGLIWTIVYNFDVKPAAAGKKANAKAELLEWIQKKIPHMGVTNLKTDWHDGRCLCALTNAIGNELYGQGTDLIPGANRLDGSQKLANCTKGSGVAASKIGVPALLSPENLANPACDENSIVTYLNMFRKASKPEGEEDDEGDMGFGADAPTTVNVVHPDGRTIVVEAGADDTTLVVKAAVEQETGIPEADQRLFFNFQQLQDRKKLGEYKISDNDTITLKTPDVVYVKVPAGDVLTIEVGPKDTILHIKKKVAAVNPATPASDQVLLFDGDDLDDKKKLKDYGIAFESTLVLQPPVYMDPVPEPEPEPVAAAAGGNSTPPLERAADWREYNGEDLGGRCRIKVYYSTTTSNVTIRKNSEQLMRLLESKGVHLRPDFEPWVPVDVDMDREFRNKIFEKAGTRETPLLFIDDEYYGNYDWIKEQNEIRSTTGIQGTKLDEILDY